MNGLVFGLVRTPKIIIGAVLVLSAIRVSASVLTVDHVWIKLAPPGVTAYAAYMTFHNVSHEDVVVLKVQADCCTMAMIHNTRIDGDMAYMDHLDKLKIPAGSDVQLAPGGLHLMLMGAKAPLHEGDKVTLEIIMENGESRTLVAAVKKAPD